MAAQSVCVCVGGGSNISHNSEALAVTQGGVRAGMDVMEKVGREGDGQGLGASNGPPLLSGTSMGGKARWAPRRIAVCSPSLAARQHALPNGANVSRGRVIGGL